MEDRNIEKKKLVVNIFHNPVTAWIILFISLALTFLAYRISSNFVQQNALDRFTFRSEEIIEAIKDRLSIYEQVLWGGVGYMYSSQKVNRAEWAKYVETININDNWPGIQGMGFSIPVKPEEKQSHIDQIRAEGFADFKIKPEGERDMYSSIIYLEPFDWRNKRAFGYDMWSNEMRREAMSRARDEGVAATSGIITLVQETEKNVQKGFLTYLPVYKTKNTPDTVELRRKEFVGWVYAPFRAGDLMMGIIGSEDPNIEFEIYDGNSINEESLLYDSNDKVHLKDANYDPTYQNTHRVTLQGRPWTILLNTPTDFLSASEKKQPQFIAIAGLIVDLLLFYVIYALYFINRKAENIARRMTRELEGNTEKIEKERGSLEEKVKERTIELEKVKDDLESQVKERTKELTQRMEELEALNKSMVGRELKMIELKEEIENLKKKQ